MDHKNNLLSRKDSKRKNFSLCDSSTAHVISVHVRNMFATYGEDTVRHVMKELFNVEITNFGERSSGVDAAYPDGTLPDWVYRSSNVD